MYLRGSAIQTMACKLADPEVKNQAVHYLHCGTRAQPAKWQLRQHWSRVTQNCQVFSEKCGLQLLLIFPFWAFYLWRRLTNLGQQIPHLENYLGMIFVTVSMLNILRPLPTFGHAKQNMLTMLTYVRRHNTYLGDLYKLGIRGSLQQKAINK